MRTKTLLLTAAVAAAGLASSMAQVYSVNIVGYVNSTLVGPSKYTLVSNPLNTTSNTYGGLLATLPAGSQVIRWTGAIFDTANKVAFGEGFTPAGQSTTPLPPGQGVFIKTPASGGNITNTWVGEVLQGSLTNTFPPGYSLKGNLVPDSGDVTAIGITAALPAAPSGSQFIAWDSTSQTYSTSTRVGFGALWTPSVPSVGVAQGFFIKNTGSSVNWVRNFTP